MWHAIFSKQYELAWFSFTSLRVRDIYLSSQPPIQGIFIETPVPAYFLAGDPSVTRKDIDR